MKKNLYYRDGWARFNALKGLIFYFTMMICSYPRLILEVFLRKNFGVRYFTLSSAVTVCVFLVSFPILLNWQAFAMGYVDMWTFFKSFGLWYAFTALFAFASMQRYDEVKRNPSVFDFAKYSRYSGDINPIFTTFSSEPNVRKIETLYEPAPFFFVGVFFAVIGQPLGYLLIFSSIIYSICQFASYDNGDNFVMDLIDDMILQERFEKNFMDDADPANNYGVGFKGRKPVNRDLRKRLLRPLSEDEFVEAH